MSTKEMLTVVAVLALTALAVAVWAAVGQAAVAPAALVGQRLT